LSAIRVGRFVASCAVLGTSLSDGGLHRLFSGTSDVGRMGTGLAWWEPQENSFRCAVWMDPDKAGRKGAERIASKLRLGGRTVRTISSRLDPKRLSDREIAEVLQESL